jgi:hypothetical protein
VATGQVVILSRSGRRYARHADELVLLFRRQRRVVDLGDMAGAGAFQRVDAALAAAPQLRAQYHRLAVRIDKSLRG